MAAIPDDCERTVTVTLPTAASSGFISGEFGTSAALDAFSTVYPGEFGISAALDAFSTVYELPLTRFEIRQTDKQTNKQTDVHNHYTSLYAARHER